MTHLDMKCLTLIPIDNPVTIRTNFEHSAGIQVWVKGVKAGSFLQNCFPFLIMMTIFRHTSGLGLEIFQNLDFFIEIIRLHELKNLCFCLSKVSDHKGSSRATFTFTAPSINLRTVNS